MHALFHLVFLLIVCNTIHSDKLQCRDENNLPVDWYVLYKLPKVSESSNALIRDGLAYLYITNVTIGTGWRLSTRPIGSSDSIPGMTLAPIYSDVNENNSLWILYNDSPPDATYVANYGHTKGVVAVNSDKGFWLIHSVPNFPPVPNTGIHTRITNKENVTNSGKYNYPESGTFYGQSFLCISLDGDQLNVVGKQLMFNEIAAYAKNIPEKFSEQYPALKNATIRKHIKSPPYNNKAVLKSSGNVEFISYAKCEKWQKDIYEDFIAPQLQSNLYVQSWLNGRGKLPSNCSRRKVFNVKSLNLKAADVDFSSSRDHSKWAITVKNKTNHHWVCIGDINRADTQFSRGGGAVCFQEARLWNNYRDAVNDIEPCPST
ncbi:deoxyribonuclease II [Megachile rotundata]|uniref:deoxyribonuclease II n=1 Tax=Megachile rotundata TaxID=143995 RepID=UPI000258F694|nr:PREDICTED: plancitoxin-1 isoform X1 [Megachile rotundata]XP_012152333.1 PREDICTED: plancitoxin-1 isoform X1 [Megachile rotundata]